MEIRDSLSSLYLISQTFQYIRNHFIEPMKKTNTHQQRMINVEQYSSDQDKRAGI